MVVAVVMAYVRSSRFDNKTHTIAVSNSPSTAHNDTTTRIE
jgi:hypothetical protein